MNKKLITTGLILIWSFQIFSQTIVYPENGSAIEYLAAKEVRRYIYLRTDSLLSIEGETSIPESGDVILVANDYNPMVNNLRGLINHRTTTGGIIIKTVNLNDRNILVITGNDLPATLQAAYRFAEHLGCGFDLAVDYVPDAKIPLSITGFDEVGVPRLAIRGIQPFHDFYAGPDLWQTDDYMVTINQLSKLGMNFIGLHTYHNAKDFEEFEWKFKGVEPTTWIGFPEDVNADGTVISSYPAWYAHTHRPEYIWDGDIQNTSAFHAGAQNIFPRDFYGSDVMGTTAMPTDMLGYNEVFNRTGRMFNKAFTFAKNIGVKTALGNELFYDEGWIPDEVLAKTDGSVSETDLRNLYRGMFTRIKNAHPLDYFWVWTFEVYQDEELQGKANFINDRRFKTELEQALLALEDVGNPFELSMAGWKLGGVSPNTFDNSLPKLSPFMSLWDQAEGFEQLSGGRVKWPATWFEEDGCLIHPRPEIQRVYDDVKAAIDKNSDGIVSKHWRTRALSMNSHAMKDLLWSYGPTGSAVDQSFPNSYDLWKSTLYQDWAERQFGSEVAQDVANIFMPLDGEFNYPLVADWSPDDYPTPGNGYFGPGVIVNDPDLEDFTFVEKMEGLRSRVQGAGNLERFDYWLKDLQAWKLMDEYGVAKSQNDKATMVNKFEQIMTLKLERLTNASDLGEILHLELMTWYKMGEGDSGPQPGTEYTGDPIIKVLPARTQVGDSEPLTLNIVAMGDGVSTPIIQYRTLGSTNWTSKTCSLVDNKVYTVTIPAQSDDFEYYIASGNVVFPVTASSQSPIYQTVVTKPSQNELQYQLKTSAENGTISPASGIYREGTVITLTATPATEYEFNAWNGDLSGSTNPDTLIMNGNKTITANFASTITSLSDIDDAKVTFYPNPTENKVIVDLGELNRKVSVEIFTMTGQLVLSEEYFNSSNISIDLDVPENDYILVITNEKGNKYSHKLLKH